MQLKAKTEKGKEMQTSNLNICQKTKKGKQNCEQKELNHRHKKQ